MTDSPLAATFRATKLKHMDSAALVFAIDHEVDHDRVDIGTLRYAIEIATAVHLSQTRIGRATYPVDPYIVHPLRNVLRLVRLGCADTDVLAATALHDTVEDQPENIVKVLGAAHDPSAENALLLIEQHFGHETARLVAAVTNPPTSIPLTKAQKNAAYAQHVADVITDPNVFLVKYADFIDNAGSVQYLQDDAKRAKLQAKYAPLVPIFTNALDGLTTALDLNPNGLTVIEAKLSRLAASLAGSATA
ncbi:HD domain-containing protein [Rhodococcoides fascians]|uniref:HD domain-containing protein n=1 Tax=Rhodococcoides fascians TaxID=1828 RepID=UPI0005609927|nr:HD domain-containing protein [Rhodococcus fascians]